jgi:hypothetical protein
MRRGWSPLFALGDTHVILVDSLVLRDATDRLLARRQTIAEPPHPDDTPLTVEELELMRAFRKIKAAEDRQYVIELAKRLSTDAP